MTSPCSIAQSEAAITRDRVCPQECVSRGVVTSHVLVGTLGFSLEFGFWEPAPVWIDDQLHEKLSGLGSFGAQQRTESTWCLLRHFQPGSTFVVSFQVSAFPGSCSTCPLPPPALGQTALPSWKQVKLGVMIYLMEVCLLQKVSYLMKTLFLVFCLLFLLTSITNLRPRVKSGSILH